MKQIAIEVLFPEFANLFGEGANVQYLARAIKESGVAATVINTALDEQPRFLSGGVDLVYLGAMTERAQGLVAEALRPYAAAIRERIAAGQFILATGNSVEIFGDGMDSPDLEGFEGLGLFHTWAHLDLWHRHNSFYLGEWKDLNNKGNTTSDTATRTSAPETTAENSTADTALTKTPTSDTAAVEIVGFKTQFGHSRTRDGNAPHATAGLSLTPLFRTKRGVDFDGTEIELDSAASQPISSEVGAYSSSWGEGVRMNNFMGTYLTGPLLILNPPFTKWLLAQLGVNNPRLPFEEAAMDSYRTRVADFHEPSRHAVLRS